MNLYNTEFVIVWLSGHFSVAHAIVFVVVINNL